MYSVLKLQGPHTVRRGLGDTKEPADSADVPVGTSPSFLLCDQISSHAEISICPKTCKAAPNEGSDGLENAPGVSAQTYIVVAWRRATAVTWFPVVWRSLCHVSPCVSGEGHMRLEPPKLLSHLIFYQLILSPYVDDMAGGHRHNTVLES